MGNTINGVGSTAWRESGGVHLGASSHVQVRAQPWRTSGKAVLHWHYDGGWFVGICPDSEPNALGLHDEEFCEADWNGCLQAFVALADKEIEPQIVARFVDRYGLLSFDESYPDMDRDSPLGSILFPLLWDREDIDGGCLDCGYYALPVPLYTELARRIRGAWRVSVALRRMKEVNPSNVPTSKDLSDLVFWWSDAEWPRQEMSERAAWAAWSVADELWRTFVKTTLSPPQAGETFSLRSVAHPLGPLGHIAVQLVAGVQGDHYPCAWCGKPTERQRGPRRGKEVLCDDCDRAHKARLARERQWKQKPVVKRRSKYRPLPQEPTSNAEPTGDTEDGSHSPDPEEGAGA